MKTTEITLAEDYKHLFSKKWRHLVYHGGRASGKSTAAAYAIILRGRQEKLRILCTREFQNSISDSVHKLLKDLIDKHGFTDYEVQRESIRNRITGTEIIFKGLRKDSQSIKSTEGIDLAWVEEAQTISKGSIDVLVPTIRKDGSQIIWTFNRINELDPVYQEFCLKPADDVYVAHVNSDVLERIGQLPETVRKERDKMKEDNPSLYAHIWLGEPISQADKAIIGRDRIIAAMNRTIPSEGSLEFGVDVARMGDDRTVFYKRKGLKQLEKRIYTKLRTTELCDKLEFFTEYDKTVLIKVDDTGVGGGVSDEMMKRGYNVMPFNFGERASEPDKYPNMISEAWFYLADIIDQVELEMDPDLLMELSSREWVMDNKGRRGVESKDHYKKKGYRSPDLADALILCFYSGKVITMDDIAL